MNASNIALVRARRVQHQHVAARRCRRAAAPARAGPRRCATRRARGRWSPKRCASCSSRGMRPGVLDVVQDAGRLCAAPGAPATHEQHAGTATPRHRGGVAPARTRRPHRRATRHASPSGATSHHASAAHQQHEGREDDGQEAPRHPEVLGDDADLVEEERREGGAGEEEAPGRARTARGSSASERGERAAPARTAPTYHHERAQRRGVVPAPSCPRPRGRRTRRGRAATTSASASATGSARASAPRRGADARRAHRARASATRRDAASSDTGTVRLDEQRGHGEVARHQVAVVERGEHARPGTSTQPERTAPMRRSCERSRATTAPTTPRQREHRRRCAGTAAARAARRRPARRARSPSTCARAKASSAANSSACITISAFG